MPNPPGPQLKDDWTSTGNVSEHVTAHNDIADHLNDLELDDLIDVDVSSTPPTAGQALVWSTAVGQFIPGSVATTGGVTSHSALSGVTSNQHHNKSHAHNSTDGSGTVAHSALTGVSSTNHHEWPIAFGSLTGTSATGTQLNTLVGGGNADALHTHTAAGTQATTDLSDWSTGTPTNGALLRYSSTAAAWTYISTTALSGSTALPTAIVEGVTPNHDEHHVVMHKLFNAILGVST